MLGEEEHKTRAKRVFWATTGCNGGQETNLPPTRFALTRLIRHDVVDLPRHRPIRAANAALGDAQHGGLCVPRNALVTRTKDKLDLQIAQGPVRNPKKVPIITTGSNYEAPNGRFESEAPMTLAEIK